MKTLFIIYWVCLFSVFAPTLTSSQYITRNGKASFFSRAPLENIEAHNQEVISVLDIEKGDMTVSILMKAFKFAKALMEEHFNENYVESDKYPKATFKGKIKNLHEINFKKDGKYPATILGEINIHGKSKAITITGAFTVKNQKITADAKFNLTVQDYDIKIPKLLVDNIAEIVEVSIHFDYEPYK